MKKSTLLIIILVGMSLFLTACPYPEPPTEEPAPPILQIVTPFIAAPVTDLIPHHYFVTPYVLQLATPFDEMTVRDPGYFYTPTPIAYPGKIKLGTLPSNFFDILRAYVTLCDGEYFAVAQVLNLGGFTFESAALSVHNLTMSRTSPALNDPFNKDSNDCPVGDGASRLKPGQSAYLYQPFEPDLRSPCVNYLVTLCSKDDLGGSCAEGGFGVCQYAVDSSPKDTPTPTTVSCDFDCDCEADQDENEYNCPKDCPRHCGNGVCDCGETGSNCKKDCGAPPGGDDDDPACKDSCGNKKCEPNCGEDYSSCPSDCIG